jgi:uncharacterized protein (DUF302 family)
MHASNRTDTFNPPSLARTVVLDDAPIDEVRFRLAHALGQEGFSVVSEVDFGDLLNRRLDKDRDRYFTYEVCHPKLAEEALAVASDAGLVFPCRICVWKEGNQVTVATLPSSRLATALGRPHLDEVAREAELRLDRVFERLAGPQPTACEIPPTPPVTLPKLSNDELDTLREATQRQIQTLLAEVAGTESHSLQHAIAHSISNLESISRKLADTAAAPARA